MPNQAKVFPTVLAHAALGDGMAVLVLITNEHCLKHHAQSCLYCVLQLQFLTYTEQFLLCRKTMASLGKTVFSYFQPLYLSMFQISLS